MLCLVTSAKHAIVLTRASTTLAPTRMVLLLSQPRATPATGQSGDPADPAENLAPDIIGDIPFLRRYQEFITIPEVAERIATFSDDVRRRIYRRLFEAVNSYPITMTYAAAAGVAGALVGWLTENRIFYMTGTAASVIAGLVGPTRIASCLQEAADNHPEETLHCMGDLYGRIIGGQGDVPHQRPERYKPCLDAAPTFIHRWIGWLMVRYRSKLASQQLLENACILSISTSPPLSAQFLEGKKILAKHDSQKDRRLDEVELTNGEQETKLDVLLDDVTLLQHSNAQRSVEIIELLQMIAAIRQEIAGLRLENGDLARRNQELAERNEFLTGKNEDLLSRIARLTGTLEVMMARNRLLEAAQGGNAEVY